MRNIKFNYTKTEELKKLIEIVYFEDNTNGRKSSKIKKIKIDSDDIFYKILSGMDYKVKIKNDIIDGSMLFDVEENKNYINLIPSSMFCVKNEENSKYSFY